VRLALILAVTASLLLLMLSGKVCMGDHWLRVGPWMLEDKVFVVLLYALVAAAFLWSTLVLLAVSAAADPRYRNLAAIAAVGLGISGLPLYWFVQDTGLRPFPWVAPTKLAVICIVASALVGGFLGYLLVRLKRSR